MVRCVHCYERIWYERAKGEWHHEVEPGTDELADLFGPHPPEPPFPGMENEGAKL